MYLGFNYDFARGIQDELLRWAEEQRKIKRVRSAHSAHDLIPRSEPAIARRIGEERLEDLKAS